jgi:hypothetical protein
LSDNRTKPIWEDGSETALYRGSGRLFRPRPGPTSLSRVKNSSIDLFNIGCSMT